MEHGQSAPGTQQPLLKVPYASYSERPFSHSALTLTLTLTLTLPLTQVGFLWQLSRQRGAEAAELEGCFMTEGAALTSSM